jgi:hypothetical protein
MNRIIQSTCPRCHSVFNSYSKWGSKKFCSRRCANSRIITNDHLAKLQNTIGKKTTIKNQFGEHPRRDNIQKKVEFIIPFTKVYLCTCKISGKRWYSATVKTIHPSVQKTKYQYGYQCRFNFSISQYSDWFVGASELIKEYGWYSTPGSRKGKRNTNGISRDHLYSVSDGFKNNVDPNILAHPANCRLVSHTENQKKRAKSLITLDELMLRIQNFESMYGDG